ncbi:hypothetical protein D1818_07510 [Aquimarina sp. BL5]|uniref:hypothetical protein n=1 Tax=Aquimarina sp. BL5 TaxID=1714860 RepID=UPI000E519DC7|nr:hypothetical protein [Aquimarina sp. BL5]AXT50685.1 hypothetical protein D1818_07510 [Aquimarina sp. BL5]RKM94216.1 hypothetical protein D7036_21940 [Aquimarina sp. BL5]
MRKLLIVLFGILQYYNCYADAGNAYRYKLKAELSDSKILTGYVYHYTYGEPYDSKKSSFCDYIHSNFNSTLIIYTEVKSLKLSESSEMDFALSSNKITFDIEEILDVLLINKLEFPAGDRVHILDSKVDYQYLQKAPLNIDSVYSEWMENCGISLINWSLKNDISKIKSKITKEVNAFYDVKNDVLNNEINSYYSNLKKELSAKKIIFIYSCEAL